MNPETNRFEELTMRNCQNEAEITYGMQNLSRLQQKISEYQSDLVRPDGSPVPAHWPVFVVGEMVVIKDYTFKVAYIGETAIMFEPVGGTSVKSEG